MQNGKSRYEGELLNGKKHGRGIYYSVQQGYKYDGEWINSVKHGLGISYEGNNKREERWAKGNRIERLVDVNTVNKNAKEIKENCREM